MKTNFDEVLAKAQAKAKETNGTDDRAFARRLYCERAMLITLVHEALKGGNMISVYDGEEWCVKKSTDKQAIHLGLFTTDSDNIVVRNKDGDRLGAFWLIYGNDGYDVISDYSVNPWTEDLWARVLKPRADALEAGKP